MHGHGLWEGGRERRSGKEEERDAVGRRRRETQWERGRDRETLWEGGRERRCGKEEERETLWEGGRDRETQWEGGRERRSGKEEDRDAGQTGLAQWSGGPLAPAIKRRQAINRKAEHEGHRHGLCTDCGPGPRCGHHTNPVVIIPTRGRPVVIIPTRWSSYQPGGHHTNLGPPCGHHTNPVVIIQTVRMQDPSSIKAAEPSALMEKSNYELSRLQ